MLPATCIAVSRRVQTRIYALFIDVIVAADNMSVLAVGRRAHESQERG